MIGEAIQSDTLKALVSQHAIREAVMGRVAGNDGKWTISVRLGGPTAHLVPVRSRREPLRTWVSLTAVAALQTWWACAGYRRAVTGHTPCLRAALSTASARICAAVLSAL